MKLLARENREEIRRLKQLCKDWGCKCRVKMRKENITAIDSYYDYTRKEFFLVYGKRATMKAFLSVFLHELCHHHFVLLQFNNHKKIDILVEENEVEKMSHRLYRRYYPTLCPKKRDVIKTKEKARMILKEVEKTVNEEFGIE